jgi:hypothetical protein
MLQQTGPKQQHAGGSSGCGHNQQVPGLGQYQHLACIEETPSAMAWQQHPNTQCHNCNYLCSALLLYLQQLAAHDKQQNDALNLDKLYWVSG